MSDIQFFCYDRWGNQKGIIADWIECVHTDELNGEDSITLDVPSHNLIKGDHLVWRDNQGTWHEHIVNGIEDTHNSEGMQSEIYAENSISELLVCWNDDLRNQKITATEALGKALKDTRWAVGTVQISNTASCNFYHQSARQSVADIIDTWGGELRTDITVSGARIVSRKVSIVAHRGNSTASKRFEYDKDIQTLSREVSEDDIYTALYGYGKGEEITDEEGNATGGYSRKITFGDVNTPKGQNWVGDNDAKAKYGIVGADGKKAHAFGSVDFSDCEDKTELLKLTKEALKTASKPKVSYTIAVINLADSGLIWENCGVGDEVQIYDKVLGEHLEGRVQAVKRFLKNEDASVITIGNIRNNIYDPIRDALNGYKKFSDRALQWDSVTETATPYIEAVINKLNKMFNEAGNSYCFTSLQLGTIWSSVPLDNEGKPTTTPATAIQINNQGFRIASTTKADGTFNWRSFGTGKGFVADEIVSGKLKADLIKTGILSDNKGLNSWNMNTGDMTFEHGSIKSTNGRVNIDMTTGNFTLKGDSGTGIVCEDGKLSIDASATDPKAVQAVAVEYVLKNSNGALVGAWSTTRPTTWGSGYALWQRTKYTLKNGTNTYVPSENGTKLEDQASVFNALTNNGATQGLYLKDGLLYLNAGYIATGTITDVKNSNYWNLNTGEFHLNNAYGSDGKALPTASSIKTTAESISLSVTNGSLGNTASINISAKAGDETFTSTGSVNLTNVRTAFKNDTTAITITAGTVTFNSNTFVVNSTYFKVSSTGVITATSGTIGGFTITDSSISNAKMTLNSSGLTLKDSNSVVGSVGTNKLNADASSTGLVFDLKYGKAFMSWGVQEASDKDLYKMKLAYANGAITGTSGGNWQAKRLHVAADMDLHGFKAYNFWIDPDSGGASGGITGTMNFTQIINANTDGSFSYSNGCYLEFKRGLLVASKWHNS